MSFTSNIDLAGMIALAEQHRRAAVREIEYMRRRNAYWDKPVPVLSPIAPVAGVYTEDGEEFRVRVLEEGRVDGALTCYLVRHPDGLLQTLPADSVRVAS